MSKRQTRWSDPTEDARTFNEGMEPCYQGQRNVKMCGHVKHCIKFDVAKARVIIKVSSSEQTDQPTSGTSGTIMKNGAQSIENNDFLIAILRQTELCDESSP